MTPDQELQNVHIFRAGKYKVIHPDGTPEWLEYSEADVKQIADNANTMLASKLHEAPAKLGHDDDQAFAKMAGLPSIGWARKVIARGKDLFADFTQVPAVVAEAIRKGRYRHVSSEIYNPTQTAENFGDAVKGFTLRAVAFLGADIPVVKGMNPLMLGEQRAFCAAEGSQIFMEGPNMEDPAKLAAKPGSAMVHLNRHPVDALAQMKGEDGSKKKVKIHMANPDDTYNVHEPDSGAVHKNVPHDSLALMSEQNPEDQMSKEALDAATKLAEDTKALLLAEQAKSKALSVKIAGDRLAAFAEKHKATFKQPHLLAALKALTGIEVSSPVKLAEAGKEQPYFDAVLEFAEQIMKAKPVLFGETIPEPKEGDNVEAKSQAVKLAEADFTVYAESHGNPTIERASLAVAARASFAENPKKPYREHLLAEAAKRLGKYSRGNYAELTQEVA